MSRHFRSSRAGTWAGRVLAITAASALIGSLTALPAQAAADPQVPTPTPTTEAAAPDAPAPDTTAPTLADVEIPNSTKLNEELVLPAAAVTDDSGEDISLVVTATGPDGVDVRLYENTDGGFPLTPEVAGTYVVTYAAMDSADNLAQETYEFTVDSPAPLAPQATDTVIELPSDTPGSISFASIGDIHNSWSELDMAFDFWHEQNVDASLFVGDLTNNATAAEYQGLRDTLDRSQGDLPVIASLGNHDVGSNLSGYNLFQSTLGQAPNADYVMNGYHFISVSPGSGQLNEDTMFPSSGSGNDYAYAADWLETRLAAAVAADPEQPVFVLVHAPLRCTHYVSNEWYGSGLATGCGDDFDSLFEVYPQAVVWGGHIHTPNHISTSIWQGAEGAGGFTTVNAPPLAYYEFERGVVNTDPYSKVTNDSTPDDGGDNRETAIVEVEGSVVTIKTYDLRANAWEDQVWTWDVAESIDDALPFEERFPLGDARADKTEAPMWPEGSAVEVSEIEPTEAMVTFNQAAVAPNEVGDIVHKYRYQVIDTATEQVVNTFTQWSGFYFMPMPETLNHIVWNTAPGREYEARISPINTWGKEGDYISTTFSTKGYDVGITLAGAGTASADLADAMPGDTVTLTATPAEGEIFLGWDVIEGDVEIVEGAFTMPSGHVSIEAVFTGSSGSVDAHAVTTTVRGNGVVSADPAAAIGGTTVTLSGEPADGNELWAWELGVDGLDVPVGTIQVDGSSTFVMPERDVTVTGVFGLPDHYGIVYDGNGATGGETASGELPVDGSGTLALNGFERDYHRFIGWGTEPDGTGERFGAGVDVRALAEARSTVTLYAQWQNLASEIAVESFDSLAGTLKPGVQHNPDVVGWTHEGPDGWSVTNADAMGADGMKDLRGWTFATPDFWLADIQGRDSFTKGTGVIAVADGDEWNDAAGAGVMDTTLNAPALTLPEGATEVRVRWDNSYRHEAGQSAEAFLEFDNGDHVTLAAWGDGSPEMDDINSHRDGVVTVPVGAKSATVKFHYTAGNNWWWAIDNVQIDAILGNAPAEFASTGIAVTGSAKVGETLTADISGWAPQPEQVSYQWLREGKVIRGADEATYDLTNRDQNKRVQVVVTGVLEGFVPVTVTSEKTDKVTKPDRRH
ncbi:metallophosphoesterase [Cryobacterium sp. TMT1-3]|uniref:InlB B-repeat-containing protein n=1 Tax=Cryobacterium sp. TMT1-3 TaxID=1259237 RepID=UPI00106B89BE|nr:metallophosphoesterase [Cryobacterium sp. TMT1-3]TFC26584.1 metallophosphoesterase [Cryobacterium sp. TMT1-3]